MAKKTLDERIKALEEEKKKEAMKIYNLLESEGIYSLNTFKKWIKEQSNQPAPVAQDVVSKTEYDALNKQLNDYKVVNNNYKQWTDKFKQICKRDGLAYSSLEDADKSLDILATAYEMVNDINTDQQPTSTESENK